MFSFIFFHNNHKPSFALLFLYYDRNKWLEIKCSVSYGVPILMIYYLALLSLLTPFRSQHTDWNILNSNQAKEIAAKAPTNKEELAECMLPENFQKEYGDRLLKNINAFIQQENLQKCIEDRQAKKRKKDSEEDCEEDDNSDY